VPQAPGSTVETRPPLPLQEESIELSRRAELPDVCMKCGTREGIVRRLRTFRYKPPWVLASLIFCCLLPIPVFAPVIIFATLMTTTKAKLNVPLCSTCTGRWLAARIAVVLSLVGVFCLMATCAIVVGNAFVRSHMHLSLIPGSSPTRPPSANMVELMLLLIGISFVAFIIVMATYVRDRTLRAEKIDDATIRIGGVHPNAALCISRAPKVG
jgi:hypothetical protein